MLETWFILDAHPHPDPQGNQKMHCTVTHIIGSVIHFLFTLRMRIEYELGFSLLRKSKIFAIFRRMNYIHMT